MDLPKVATTKSKYSNEMLTVTRISNVSEIVFYIYFLIKDSTKIKQLLDYNCLI